MKLVDGYKIWVVALVNVSVNLACLSSAIADLYFQGLGDLPGAPYTTTGASGVSADGSIVVGSSSYFNKAFRWTQAGGMVSLGYLTPDHLDTRAHAVSADGSAVVGTAYSDIHVPRAFRWTEATEMVYLGNLGYGCGSGAGDVSADGSVVVGAAGMPLGGGLATRWTQATGMVSLGDLPGGVPYQDSSASGVSGDGSVIVGQGKSASGYEAFRWEDLNGNGVVDDDEKLDNHPELGLGDLPGGGFSSSASAVSVDGSVVVGSSQTGPQWYNTEAFIWENGTMVGLGDLPGGGFRSFASDVSADGSVVVGGSQTAPEWYNTEAFIWDEHNGMRNLKDVLVTDYGLDLTGWTLSCAYGISANGLTFVGSGINPDARMEAWIATVPAPGAALLGVIGLGVANWRLRKCRMTGGSH